MKLKIMKNIITMENIIMAQIPINQEIEDIIIIIKAIAIIIIKKLIKN